MLVLWEIVTLLITLEKPSNKLKLTTLLEKSFWPNSLSYISKAQWAGEAGHCSQISISWDHLSEPNYPRKLNLTASTKNSLQLNSLRKAPQKTAQ
jgi:hypothetical protein